MSLSSDKALHMTLVERVQALLVRHGSLFANTGSMTIAAGSTSVLGFVYWWYAARVFPPHAIGVASALISLITLVDAVGNVGLGALVVGELGRWPDKRDGLISAAFLTCMTTCLILGVITLPLSRAVGLRDAFDAVMVVSGCGLTGLATIADQAVIGMLKTNIRLARQIFYSVVRLATLVALAFWVADETGMLVSWVCPIAGSLILAEFVSHRYGESLVHKPDFKFLFKLRRQALDHYMLDLGMITAPIIMPYLTTVLVSPTANAAFTVIWLIVATASVVPSSFAHVLFPVVRADPDQYQEKMRLSLVISLLFTSGFAVFLYLSVNLILSVFNPIYVEIGGTHLGFLGFGLIGSVIKYHFQAAARLSGRMRKASFWVCVGTVFELTIASLGAVYGGLFGLSVAWPLAAIIEGLIILLVANPCKRPSRVRAI